VDKAASIFAALVLCTFVVGGYMVSAERGTGPLLVASSR
jgi:hypothetical protein